MSYEELFVRLLLENLRNKPRQVSAIAFQISSAYMIAYAFSSIKSPYMNILVLPLTIAFWMCTLVSNWWLFNKVSIDEVAKDVVGMLPEVIKELNEDISIGAFINRVIEKLTSPNNKISVGKAFALFAAIAIPYMLALVFTLLFIERVLDLPIMNLQGMYLAIAVFWIALTCEILSASREAEVRGGIMGIAKRELVNNVFDVIMPRFTTLASIVKGAFGRKLSKFGRRLSKILMIIAIVINDLLTPSPIISLLTHENEKDNETSMVTALIPCNELVIKDSRENSVDALVSELMTQCIKNLQTALSSLGAQPLCVDEAVIGRIVNNLRTILGNCLGKCPNSINVREEACDVRDVAGVPQLLSARLLQCVAKALIEFPGCIENNGSLIVLTLLMKNYEIKYQVSRKIKVKGYICKPRNTDTLKIPIIVATGIHRINLNLILAKQLIADQAQDGNADNARNSTKERIQPQQTPNTTARAEENNGETTENNAGVMTNKPP
ncbi:hypothetical protein B7L70_01770 [Vulcanisaeta sp. EB80]|uniref:hypothetical protein n=1 Tax=Vulcanisaeta sp. EB80 TaxID=1650660 RepID=UPI0009BF1602|nr:hypothetical protein [Vulcanisaeta sp. EB80]PLC68710.1 hypothetical protein B7L70_01770 [Vulcanisaeta sp. EB80]